MGAPASPVGGTLTVTDSSSPQQVASIPVTIQISPVVSEAALHVAVFSRIAASQSFATSLDHNGSGFAYFQNLVLNEANRQGAVLSPAEYPNLMTVAKSLNKTIRVMRLHSGGCWTRRGAGGWRR